MAEQRRLISRDDAPLVLWSVLIGLAGATVFAIYRAVSVSNEDTAGRLAEFAANLAWPGVLIFAVLAAVVFGAWKANLD
jgi:hypothetical protein